MLANSLLFSKPDDRAQWTRDLLTRIADAEQRIKTGSVSPDIDMEIFRRELASFTFQRPCGIQAAYAWTITQMEHGLVHINHPRYMGLFNPGPNFPAQCAEYINASFNPQLASATTSPVAVAIEAHVISAVASRAGLGEQAGGNFTSGGSEANYTALLCALTRAHPNFSELGSRAFSGRPVFYVSRDSHLAWVKIAHQVGIGRDAVRMVQTDGLGQMSMKALVAAIETDLHEGRVPVMLAATAGTTNAGMIDPLEDCAEIARDHGLWYHVDAAWGGGVIALGSSCELLHGIQRADSITVDAHKWFASVMGCGMFLTRQSAILRETFGVSADFMPSQAGACDPYMNSVQWSRRFIGLGMFLSLAAGGWAAHAEHVRRSIDLAATLSENLQKLGWGIVNSPKLAVVCFEAPAGSPGVREIAQNVVRSGRAWISIAQFEGRDVIRACITHGETSSADLSELVTALEQARRRERIS